MSALGAVLMLVGVALTHFAAYRYGVAHGRADRIRADVDRRVAFDLERLTGRPPRER